MSDIQRIEQIPAANRSNAPRAKIGSGFVAWNMLVEGGLYVLFLLFQAILIQLKVVPLDWLIRINTFFLLMLCFAAWKRFEGGMHICFLFIGTLLLFQAGRMLAFTFNPVFGNVSTLRDPFTFVLMRDAPFDVTHYVAEMTMLVIVSSAVLIYLPCSLRFAPAHLPPPLSTTRMRALYRIYFGLLPFLLYKNIRYFLFIRSHGGYLALYLDRDQLLASVDIVTRVLSLLASTAFVAIFLFEQSRRRIYWVTFTYFIAAALDLLIGMRGKVFTLLLTLWFIQNLKRHRHFRLGRLIIPGILLIYVAMAAANFRENLSAQLLSPLGFVAEQGISMQVTEAVVGFRDGFVQNPVHYLIEEIKAPFFPKSEVTEPQGESLAGDLAVFLSPSAAAEGYGPGSSYIAEAYLFAGFLGVIVVSLMIGFGLSWLHSHLETIGGAVLLAYTMPTLIYLPRSTLFDPLSFALKTIGAIFMGLPLLFLAEQIPEIAFFKRQSLPRVAASRAILDPGLNSQPPTGGNNLNGGSP